MTGKYRKIKSLGEIDCWLEVKGYYRKNVAYDETCLFRAVTEQVNNKLKFLKKQIYDFILFYSCMVHKHYTKKYERNVLITVKNIQKNFNIC